MAKPFTASDLQFPTAVQISMLKNVHTTRQRRKKRHEVNKKLHKKYKTLVNH